MAFRTEVAEASETSCSPERPPKSTATRSFSGNSPISQQADLQLELDAEPFAHGRPRQLDQGEDVGGDRAAAVDDEVGVGARDLGAPAAPALQAGGLDHPAGVVTGWVLEDAAGAGERRLAGFPQVDA